MKETEQTPEEKKDFDPHLPCVSAKRQVDLEELGRKVKAEHIKKLNKNFMTPQEAINSAHSYTESAYKEFESSEPQEKEPYVLEVVGNFLHSSGLVFNTDDADHVASDLIRYLKVEGISIAKSAPSESQEEMWKEVVDAFYYCSTNEQYLLAEQAIKKKFTITRKPE